MHSSAYLDEIKIGASLLWHHADCGSFRRLSAVVSVLGPGVV